MAEKKRGRPPLETARTIRKGLLLTPAENTLLEETAAIYGLSYNSTFVRGLFELHQKAKTYEQVVKRAKESEKKKSGRNKT